MWETSLALLFLLSSVNAESAVVSFNSDVNVSCPQVRQFSVGRISSPFSYDVPDFSNRKSRAFIGPMAEVLSVIKTITFYLRFSSVMPANSYYWSMEGLASVWFYLGRNQHKLDLMVGDDHAWIKPLTLDTWHVVRISIDANATGTLFVSLDDEVLINSPEGYNNGNIRIGEISMDGSGAAVACFQFDSTGTTSLPSPRESCIDSSPCFGQSPTIEDQNDKFCDTDDPTPCNTISFDGTGFTSEDSYTCLIQKLELGDDGNFTESTTTVANATFISTEQVVCSLTTSGQVILSSAEHGDISEPVTSLIFPALCLNCLADLSCTATGNGCLINGKCLRPFTLVGPTEVCLPSENVYGGSAPPKLNVTLDSCGQVHRSNVSLRAVDGGFGLEPGALAALSSSISFEFFARFLPGITENRTVAQLGPGLKVLQVPGATGDTVVFQLQFSNYLTGEKAEPVSVTINLGRASIRIRAEIRLGGGHTHSRSRESGWFAFHFVSGQASFFFEDHKLDVDLGDLSNLQLFTTGLFFLSNETFVCADLSTEIPELQGNGTELGAQSDCEPVVKLYEEGNAGCADQPA